MFKNLKMQNKELQAETKADSEQMSIDIPSRPNAAKPNVVGSADCQHGYKGDCCCNCKYQLKLFCHPMNGENKAFGFLEDKVKSFDVIIFNDVIEHLTKDEIVTILDLMNAALKDGGCIIIKTPNMANPFTAAPWLFQLVTNSSNISSTCKASLKKNNRLHW